LTLHASSPYQVKRPDPLVIDWQGRQLRVRHDDRRLTRSRRRAVRPLTR
jgi:hypothetical protein